MTRQRLHVMLPAFAALLAASCDAGPTVLHGAVQKGPFVIGSTVQVQLLDDGLIPTGTMLSTTTRDDVGEFDLTFRTQQPISLEGTGYYYNEISGELSTSTLTLRALFVPTAGEQAVYVNAVTHLTTERIRALVTGGTAFADAVTQAEAELVSELAITYPGFTPRAPGAKVCLTQGDDEQSAYLLAVSAVLTTVAQDRGGDSLDAQLQELLNRTALDLADGTIEDDLKAEVAHALEYLSPELIGYLLGQRFAEIGVTEPVPNINRVLDRDHDGQPDFTGEGDPTCGGVRCVFPSYCCHPGDCLDRPYCVSDVLNVGCPDGQQPVAAEYSDDPAGLVYVCLAGPGQQGDPCGVSHGDTCDTGAGLSCQACPGGRWLCCAP
jgi:hypothetical protein